LVGWKYEVDGDRESTIRAAEKQIAECLMDACVANGPAYGLVFGLVRNERKRTHIRSPQVLFEALEKLVAG